MRKVLLEIEDLIIYDDHTYSGTGKHWVEHSEWKIEDGKFWYKHYEWPWSTDYKSKEYADLITQAIIERHLL